MLDWQKIDRVLLTGGMTRMPSVREMIKNLSHVEIAEDLSRALIASPRISLQALAHQIAEGTPREAVCE